jgi:hypothetical protein
MTQDAQDLAEQKNMYNNLQARLQELEALVKGLTDEMLDLKAMVLNLQKENRTAPVIREIQIQNQERPSPIQPVITASPTSNETPSSAQTSTNINTPSPKNDNKEDTVGNSSKKSENKENIVLKMQPDGTLRPTAEDGENIIVASVLDSHTPGKQKKNVEDIIVADE